MRRRRREPYKWSKRAEKLLKVLKTKEIKKIERRCRELIDDFSVFNIAGGASRVRSIPFQECGYDFVLEWDYADEIWILNVVRLPVLKDGEGLDLGDGDDMDRLVRAIAARARRPRKKFMKRNLLVMYKKLRVSRFGRILGRYLSDKETVRGFFGIEALARSLIGMLGLGGLMPGILAMLGWFTRPRDADIAAICDSNEVWLESRLVRLGAETTLALSTTVSSMVDSLWDSSWFGVRLIESERMRL